MEEIEEGWVVRNLRTFGNSVVPNEEIREYGIPAIEKAILQGAGLHIRIRKGKVTSSRDVVTGKMLRNPEDDLYIAEVVK